MSTYINLLITSELNDIVSEIHNQKRADIDKCAPPAEGKCFLKCNYSTTFYRR